MALSGRLGRLLLLALLPSVAAPALAADEAGERAYRAGDYAEAFRRWAPLAEAGDPAAQLGLGTLYDLGKGVARDAGTAAKWYRQAAEAGLPDAEFNLAVMCDSGDGVPRDPPTAAAWYARAAAHGSHRAEYDLGQLYRAGEGVPANRDIAAAWFRRAAPALPAAAMALARIGRERPAALAARSEPGEEPMLRPAEPVVPADGAGISGPAAASKTPRAVELAWTAPAQARQVRFFVQLLAVGGEGGPREVFSASVDVTAVLAPLRDGPGHYAWRVYSISDDARHYAASDWQWFWYAAAE